MRKRILQLITVVLYSDIQINFQTISCFYLSFLRLILTIIRYDSLLFPGLELEESEEKKEKFECHEEVGVVTVQTPVETCLVTSRPRQERVSFNNFSSSAIGAPWSIGLAPEEQLL